MWTEGKFYAAVEAGSMIFGAINYVDGVLGLKLEFVDLLRINEDVLTFGVLVTFDDFLVRHLREGVTITNALHLSYGRA
jgi:hypothetical protein